MFDTYQDIFKQRADSYHAAMAAFPLARQEEFHEAVSSLALEPGCSVCDIPAGGGYLCDFIDAPVDFLFVETSTLFANHCPRDERHRVLQTASLEDLPVADESMHRVLSLAAMHHVPNKSRAVSEVQRMLKPGGRAVIADVEVGTGTAKFLNEFVNQYNSMGHEGRFLDKDFYDCIEGEGLVLSELRRPEMQWGFTSVDDMTTFCTQLFGLDLASPQDVLSGIETHLGYVNSLSGVAMNWQLVYAVLDKPV